jgi:ABC-type polysaccharide/polyol phosphate export permease
VKVKNMAQIPIYDTATHLHPAIDEIKNISNYRFLIFQLVRRDILTRYKRSVLGVAWTMLNPLGTMLVLSIVFSQLFATTTPAYPLYILSGLMAWNFFSQSTNAAMSSMVWGGSLLHRIYIPRSSFVISAIFTAMVNFTLSIVPLLIVSLVLRVPLKLTAFFLPVPMLLLACFSLGLGLILSTMAIYFPDVSEMYQIVLTAWMYLTPVIYPENIIPVAMQPFLRLNPLYYLVNIYRIPFYDGRLPVWSEFWPAMAWSLGILVLGWILFTSKADEFAYRV